MNYLMALLGLCVTTSVVAFPCHVTLIKDSCWKDYEVTVDIIDSGKDTQLTSVVVPKNELWARVKFECEPKQSFLFVSKFAPAFWTTDEGKVYNAKRYWSLPESILPNVTAWNMNICYPDDFSEVPLPPNANNACACSTKGIPAVEP